MDILGSRLEDSLHDIGFYAHPNRTMCEVLSEMRTIVKLIPIVQQRNLLLSLIEEAQVYGNRMESGLLDKKDLLALQKKKKELIEEINNLSNENK